MRFVSDVFPPRLSGEMVAIGEKTVEWSKNKIFHWLVVGRSVHVRWKNNFIDFANLNISEIVSSRVAETQRDGKMAVNGGMGGTTTTIHTRG